MSFAIRARALPLALGALFIALAQAPPLRAALPEPGGIYYGEVQRNGVAELGHTVSLRLGTTILDTYQVGSAPGLGNLYLVRARLFQPTFDGEQRPSGGAFVGDQLSLLVNGVPAATVTVTGRGLITLRNLTTIGATFTPTPSLAVPTPTSPGAAATATATGSTRTPTKSPTPPTTPTVSPSGQSCFGDCNADGKLTASDLGRINALILRCGPCPGNIPGGVVTGCPSLAGGCAPADFNKDGCLRASELGRANQNILRIPNGCELFSGAAP